MKLILTNRIFSKLIRVAAALAWAFLATTVLGAAPQSAATKATTQPVPGAKLFNTPEQAADALVDAAAKFDVDTLYEIFGPNGEDIYLTGEYRKTGSVLLTLLPRLTKRKMFPWIQKRGTGHSSSWATRIGPSPCRS
jgi:hypothetical protein